MDPEILGTPEMLACDMPEEQPAEVALECLLPPEKTDETDRLAEEFIHLSEEFPELSSPAQLPDEVLQTAAEENISLLDAYLRYRWQEEKQVREAARLRALAAQQSAGSLAKGAEKRDPAPDGFLRAFRAALR